MTFVLSQSFLIFVADLKQLQRLCLPSTLSQCLTIECQLTSQSEGCRALALSNLIVSSQHSVGAAPRGTDIVSSQGVRDCHGAEQRKNSDHSFPLHLSFCLFD
eukprot:Selendium_serpulae@DN6283_c3_g1_i2.p1